ncbi:protein Wiz-like isoform X1 [Synchiropus splendidus]|uniref:protein Wiz-like isoform X1 n=1 Tax=Synchiropus splendidus TaxID=270530 RepID=UPI00237E87AB|nr:protein Wiz-like isoform X1 [Synchiropus splendidus]XP_053711784.1 protein Wiz-like isoform X1 [Synchiropus splendidus]XP_053711785.1 protein Wiz-like isoform X1 [Synchiropus splendidus]
MDPVEGPTAAAVTCEFCGTHFETRRGLSSHARLHLRQLGVTMSDSSGAPIELLYQLMEDREGDLTNLKLKEPLPDSPQPRTSSQKSAQKGSRTSLKSNNSKTPTSKVKSKVATSTQAGSSLWTSPILPSSPSAGPEGSKQLKPFWAPLETDAPITLASDKDDEVHVCQMCGCWFESRKGLSRHALSHLRQLGIPPSAVKGNPIEFLSNVMESEDHKLLSSKETELLGAPLLSKPSPKRSPEPTSELMSPPSKQSKTSKDCKCIFCGEEFGNRKGLASHARSHLRQMGLLYLVGEGTAISTMQELVHSGILKRTQSDSPSSPAPSPLSPDPGHSHTSIPSSCPSPTKPTQGVTPRPPKAKKGFRLAVDPLQRKPKQEPVDMEVSPSKELVSSCRISTEDAVPANTITAEDQSPPTVLCNYCGQLFETRKALSCHARSHLRQLGLTWSINTSPLELLREFMAQSEDGTPTWDSSALKTLDQQQSAEQSSNPYSSPLNFSMKENSSPAKSGAAPVDKTCELCGFEFENRKALASHARAHLRQLGLSEWKSEGANSPIEFLRDIMRRDPTKVAAVMRRYRMGDLYIKKSNKSATASSSETDSLGVSGPEAPELKSPRGGAAGSSRPHSLTLTTKIHFDQGVRSQRAHPPKKTPVGDRSRESGSQPPPRTGGIPAMLPKPPLTPLVKLVGKVYTLKCRFCERVFEGPLSVQEQWITHLQQHILTLGYKGKASPPVTPALINPVAV